MVWLGSLAVLLKTAIITMEKEMIPDNLKIESDINKKLVENILNEDNQREILYQKDDLLDKIKSPYPESITEVTILGRILDKINLAEQFIEIIPLYYDEIGLFWRFDRMHRKWIRLDDIDLLNIINKSADVNIINSRERGEIMNALKQVARLHKPKDLGDNFIQFDKEIINLETGDRFVATEEYFCTNPIPHKLGKYPDVEKFDKLFEDWVGKENINILYEILAYCMIPSYPIERIFCLHGSGSNGKSVFQKILQNFIGFDNGCSTTFRVLCNSRFESSKLYKKSYCLMSETNITKIESTDIIKKLCSGKDLIGAEYKGKNHFDFINFAKLIISTNTLPPTDDKTDGFYRKWQIIDFPNTFEIEKDVLKGITEQDYENLANKCLNILNQLMIDRKFSGEGNFKQRRDRYEERSNPIDKFLVLFTNDDPQGDISKWEFAKKLNEWLQENKIRQFSDVTINKILKEKGYISTVLMKEWYENQEPKSKAVKCWAGMKWKE